MFAVLLNQGPKIIARDSQVHVPRQAKAKGKKEHEEADEEPEKPAAKAKARPNMVEQVIDNLSRGRVRNPKSGKPRMRSQQAKAKGKKGKKHEDTDEEEEEEVAKPSAKAKAGGSPWSNYLLVFDCMRFEYGSGFVSDQTLGDCPCSPEWIS